MVNRQREKSKTQDMEKEKKLPIQSFNTRLPPIESLSSRAVLTVSQVCGFDNCIEFGNLMSEPVQFML